MKQPSLALVAIAAAAVLSAGVAQAKPFKWASQADVASWDIHAGAVRIFVFEALRLIHSGGRRLR